MIRKGDFMKIVKTNEKALPATRKPTICLSGTAQATFEEYRDTLVGLLDKRIEPTVDLVNKLFENTLEVAMNNHGAYTPEQCETLATLLARWSYQLPDAEVAEDDEAIVASDAIRLFQDMYLGTLYHD